MTKKTLKAILAAALAVIMVIPCFSAFAANNTLTWNFYGTDYTYDYAGEMTLGTTAIPDDASDFIWYSFDVPEEGFYLIRYNYVNLDAWFGIPEDYEGTTAYNEKPYLSYEEEYIDGSIYFIEAGKTIVAFDIYLSEENAAFETEFLGSEITEVKPHEDLIYNYDVYDYEYMGEIYCDLTTDVDITFSNGFTVTEYYLEGTTEKALVAGENTFKTTLFNKDYEFNANVYYITDYVESVEIENYLHIYSYYYGEDYFYPWGELLKVTFKDGSTYTVNTNYSDVITLPNGREVSFGFDVSSDNSGNYYMDVYVGGTSFASYKCEYENTSVEENIFIMTEISKNYLADASFYFKRAFEVALEDGILGIFNNSEAAMMRIEWAISSFMLALDEFTYFILYLLS